ncbi:DegT/DnrJ/EryC1/StrS family aminotransferase [Prevotella brunnea]|uniref:DegT/DnrJ/EryC1/StrS family aminotransferase n=1 Tax=Prevotella brunnea TaxID=2508867 RepID=A0A5C8GC22_9BACT|nr:DegT/DnrJ/EryC1/StrS family aminotransferase [Prevotella brunnea]TXJ58818.1 DegT/DnrJ/EryC1/StrS family aminotransferase [Prevotella brunnea]
MIEYLSLKKVTEMHSDEIFDAIQEVIRSGWYLQGEAVGNFEKNYADYIGTKHCVTCGNGLDALSLILRAYKELGILHDGDEIIAPANTYIATLLSISENNLIPILVEPNIDTLEIDDRLIDLAITPRTRAIMLVHLYGRCAYTRHIEALRKHYNLLLIEDNAQAHGCTFADKRTGSLGNAAAHSFYPGKNIGALGDAGAVTTNDKRLADVIRMLGNYGSERKYEFTHKGMNSRMDELQAAILNIKLKYIDKENARRKEIAHRYQNEIKNTAITIPNPSNRDNVYHIFPILCETRNKLQSYLNKHGVQTMIHYPIPPHKQKAYREWNQLSFPITEQIHEQELSIPCNQTITEEETDTIIRLLNSYS